jgi:DNA-binding phage protein
MGKTKTTRYDVAEHLRTSEQMAAYLEACIEESDGDAAFVAKALSGKQTPSFETVLKVVRALGMELHAAVSTPPATSR